MFWMLMVANTVLAVSIGVVIMRILETLAILKEERRKKKIAMKNVPEVPDWNPPLEVLNKNSQAAIESGKEWRMQQEMNEGMDKRKDEKLEKKVEIRENRSEEEWTPVPEDFKMEVNSREREMGPITIKTHTVADKDIFQDHKPEPPVAIEKVQFSDEILVYSIGAEDVEVTKSSKDGSSSHGGSSIMTASLKKLEPKF